MIDRLQAIGVQCPTLDLLLALERAPEPIREEALKRAEARGAQTTEYVEECLRTAYVLEQAPKLPPKFRPSPLVTALMKHRIEPTFRLLWDILDALGVDDPDVRRFMFNGKLVAEVPDAEPLQAHDGTTAPIARGPMAGEADTDPARLDPQRDHAGERPVFFKFGRHLQRIAGVEQRRPFGRELTSAVRALHRQLLARRGSVADRGES